MNGRLNLSPRFKKAMTVVMNLVDLASGIYLLKLQDEAGRKGSYNIAQD